MSNLDTSTDGGRVLFIEDLIKKLEKLENKIENPVWILASDDYCKDCEKYIEWAIGAPIQGKLYK